MLMVCIKNVISGIIVSTGILVYLSTNRTGMKPRPFPRCYTHSPILYILIGVGD